MSFVLDEKEFKRFCQQFFDFFAQKKLISSECYADFELAFASSLDDIYYYCHRYKIKITALDQIKVLAFSIPYLQKYIPTFSPRKYLFGIFNLLNDTYIYNKNFAIDSLLESIDICCNLIDDKQIIAVYTYIKGFQESMEAIIPDKPFLYQHKKENLKKITQALISVSDKTGVLEFAKSLKKAGITIFASVGTAKYLSRRQVEVIDIEQYTNFPEMMNSRIKTINPKIHGGILARRDQDFEAMKKYNIPPIDLVVVNLYPFEQTIAQENCTLAEAIENIDIGGPAMLRAAAKNHKDVTVIVDSSDYEQVLNEVVQFGNTRLKTRQKLALKAFEHTTKYDGAIANYLGRDKRGFSSTLNLQFKQKQALRYGENAHQKAALYIEHNISHSCVVNSTQIQGTVLSYNNIADADAALECIKQFKKPACVIVKHTNPAGVAVGENIFYAYLAAHKTDPISAFGGIIAFNQVLDFKTVQTIISRQFVEVIIAPDIENKAKAELAKKPNVRLLVYGKMGGHHPVQDYRSISGGLLVQDKDTKMVAVKDLQYVTKIKPTAQQLKDLLFAQKVAKFVKSNAIVYAKNQATIAIGAGQMSRVYATKIAGLKAQDVALEVAGSVMASDAFFPFRDSVDVAKTVGIRAIIQPGGSKQDHEVITAADAAGIAMVLSGIRHFRH